LQKHATNEIRTVIKKKRRDSRPKARLGESLKKKWENKVMHGQYVRSMDRQPISTQDTFFLWLKQGVLKGDTESEIIAAQDQALQTRYHATNVLQTETYSKFDETTDNILSACPVLAKHTSNTLTYARKQGYS